MLVACSGSDPGPGGDDDDTVGMPGVFEIQTPDIVLAPGEESTYCYFTTAPVTEDVGVSRWESHMTPGSHHLIVYFTDTAGQPDGTLTQNCDAPGAPVWTYSTSRVDGELVMPSGVGMTVAAGQKLFVQMHYLNTTESDLTVSVNLKGHTFPSGQSYVRAAPYITFHPGINVPAGQTGSAEGTCAVPPDKKFFIMSTHAHRFATRTEVFDGQSMVFESDDWEEPGAVAWAAEPFYSFGTNLRYRCEYNNTLTTDIQTGDSAQTDEMCMAVGYFFPADDGPIFCLGSTTF
jgi:hypothetical protein